MIVYSSLTNKGITLNSEDDVHYISALILSFQVLFKVRKFSITTSKNMENSAIHECLIDVVTAIRNCAEYSPDLTLQFFDNLGMIDPDNIQFIRYKDQ